MYENEILDCLYNDHCDYVICENGENLAKKIRQLELDQNRDYEKKY